MTRLEAVCKLMTEKELSTDILEPLNIGFESFLKYCQLPEKTQKEIIIKLIKNYNCIFFLNDEKGQAKNAI